MGTAFNAQVLIINDGNGDGNKDRIGDGRGGLKKRKNPHKNCRRDVGNGVYLDGKKKT